MHDRFRVLATRFGYLALLGSARGLQRLVLPDESEAAIRVAVRTWGLAAREESQWLPELCGQLVAYFEGEPAPLNAPLDLSAGSAFEADVWHACRAIPYGETRTYGQLADWVQRPGGARAVGHAMSRNPLPLVIPCHRVLRGDGSLGGYSGPGGVAFKRRLLDMEARALRGAGSIAAYAERHAAAH